jgi:hypothetical protein
MGLKIEIENFAETKMKLLEYFNCFYKKCWKYFFNPIFTVLRSNFFYNFIFTTATIKIGKFEFLLLGCTTINLNTYLDQLFVLPPSSLKLFSHCRLEKSFQLKVKSWIEIKHPENANCA